MRSEKPSADVKAIAGSPNPAADDPRTRGQHRRRGVAEGLRIVGEIKGREDLFIAGEVNGSIYLPDCMVHVGPEGSINASITARHIEIEGAVTGDLVASERIIIRSSGAVTGDVTSPQIRIDEGCNFKGSVQMSEPDLDSQPRTPKDAAAND
jgi:cytoskeletal protein CcmA (bactofilin family)